MHWRFALYSFCRLLTGGAVVSLYHENAGVWFWAVAAVAASGLGMDLYWGPEDRDV